MPLLEIVISSAAAIALCVVCLAEFQIRRGKLALASKAPKGRRLLRTILYTPLVLLLVVVGALCLPNVWQWYAATSVTDLLGLGVSVTAATTAWAGSLVAFTIMQRVTPKRAYGLRFLSFTLILGLLPMAFSGAVLRTTLLLLAIGCGLWGCLQIFLQTLSRRSSIKLSLSIGDYDFEWEELPEEERAAAAKHATALEDSVVTFVHGGRYWVVLAMGFLIAFAFPTSKVITAVCGIALLLGLQLVYRSIVDPFTPQYGGDPFEKWKTEHLTTEMTTEKSKQAAAKGQPGSQGPGNQPLSS